MNNSSAPLAWLINDRLVRVEYFESYAWRLHFESGATLYVGCTWRKIEKSVIVCTSEDHGHKFGLPTPIDGIALLEALSQFPITAVTVQSGTADILIEFGEDASLEIISTSAGYEPWSASHPKLGKVVATGQGRLHYLPSVGGI